MAVVFFRQNVFSASWHKAGAAASVPHFHAPYGTDSGDVNSINLSALKRGTGGRSSFNGLVTTVFGASGFVGRYLCNKLGKIGTQLIIPYRGDQYDVLRLKVVGDLGQVLYQPYHLLDETSIRKAVKYSNVVINLVGRDWETRCFKFNDVHVKGARLIARIARESRVEKLIHVSALNACESPQPLLLKNGSQFLKSKWEGENAVREEFPDAVIIRPGVIYGPEDRFLRHYCHAFRQRFHWVPLWRKGEATIKQPVYVSDVAAAIVNAVKDPDCNGKVFQAVGPKRYHLSDLVEWFHKLLRREVKYGFVSYDMRYDPIFQLRVTLNQAICPGWPIAYLHWEGLEKEHVSDVFISELPTLEDLGVTLTHMENQVPWELRPSRALSYYDEELGEFEKPPPPAAVA